MNTPFKIMLAAAVALAVPALVGAADAAADWKAQCAKCHGADGSGDTAMGKKLKLKDYRDAAVQAAMTDEEMFKATKEGIPDTKMPAYADRLSDEQITALVALIRSFKTQ